MRGDKQQRIKRHRTSSINSIHFNEANGNKWMEVAMKGKSISKEGTSKDGSQENGQGISFMIFFGSVFGLKSNR